MINSDETIIDQNRINSDVTILDQGDSQEDGVKRAGETPITSEDFMLEDYHVTGRLSRGAQAEVFLAEKDKKKYVVKLYGRDWQPVKLLRDFFKENRHDNIMPVVMSGRELGRYYEIYPYYEHGTLEHYVRENGTLSVEFIKKCVVPSVNEGLYFLHTNRIVHCDIKPVNLYLDKNGDDWRVIIGDLGSCRVMDSDGLVRASLEGTVNFSVPVEDYYGVKTFPKEYDYASLGITLYSLYTNARLMEGMKLDERARLWDRSVEIPVDDIRLKSLLSGLIDKDFENVWGYEELKRWSETGWNSSRKRRIARREDKKPSPLIFGNINGSMTRVSTLHELTDTCKKNWELARTVIKRFDTLQFIRQFDSGLYDRVEKELKSRSSNEDIILFRALYTIEKSNRICYRGEDMGTLSDFLERLENRDELAIEFVIYDLFTFYMEIMGAESSDIDRVDELVKLNRLNALGMHGLIEGICRAFRDDQHLKLEGVCIDNMNDFADYIADKSPRDINTLLKKEKVQAWFIAMGFAKEIEELKTLI